MTVYCNYTTLLRATVLQINPLVTADAKFVPARRADLHDDLCVNFL
jgi:hypothetical protein